MSTANTEPAQPEDPWIGRTVGGQFRLGRRIGEGAMGRVYRGEQLSLGKPVAIKVLHKHLGGDPRIARRFHREAKAASRLSHPNSVQIIDFGEDDDGTLYIAMELLEGEDLQAIIDHDAPFTPARIGDLIGQTLLAVEEAHHAGIIHRDLKPENVLVLRERGGRERVKVCDFGIAKITESEGRSTAITKDGYVCGTPEYMAPEQAKGDPIDARVDVYAAGVMLYQMLCGRVPFKAETALGLITKHIMDPPEPPRRLQPSWGIPRSLEKVALRALEKSPEDRFESAEAMASAVRAAVDALGARAEERLGHGSFAEAAASEPIEDDTPEADGDDDEAHASTAEAIAKVVPTRRGYGWLAALVLSAGVFAFGLWLWLRPPPPAPPPSGSPGSGGDVAARTEAGARGDIEDVPLRAGDEDRGGETRTADGERAGGGAPIGADEPGADEPEADEPGEGRSGGEPARDGDRRGGGQVDDGRSAGTGAGALRGANRSGTPFPDRGAVERRATGGAPPESPRTGAGTRRSAAPAPGASALEEGRARMLRGDLRGAIASLEEAARDQPQSAQVQKQLGRAYMRSGDIARGIAAYRRYLALNPDAPDRAIVDRIIAQHGG